MTRFGKCVTKLRWLCRGSRVTHDVGESDGSLTPEAIAQRLRATLDEEAHTVRPSDDGLDRIMARIQQDD